MAEKACIRVVDDDQDLLESLEFLLESEGWKVKPIAALRIFSEMMLLQLPAA